MNNILYSSRFAFVKKSIWAIGGFAIAASSLMTSCTADDDFSSISPVQEALLGRAVNFDLSISDPFITRASYNDDGSFNDNDRITIFREYWDETAQQFISGKSYRVYSKSEWWAKWFNINKWEPIPDQIGKEVDWIGSGHTFINDTDPTKSDYATFVQTETDSMTWDNKTTVRFRAMGRSNYADALNLEDGSYYPDFTISEAVTAAGPTENIPLEMKHLGSRIVFTYKDGVNGNYLVKVEVCTDPDDYKRDDNADKIENDDKDKNISDAEAQTRANAVAAVYNRMCMPSGVDVVKGQLYALPNTYTGDFKNIEAPSNTDAHIGFATKTAAEVTSTLRRPVFYSINSSCYFITIPYDFSKDETTSGEMLTFPSYTRFKITLQDVNNGDKGTDGEESTYHIFALSDIMDGTTPKFPDGLDMKAGYSYLFKVGYRYDKFKVEYVEDLSWIRQDEASGDGTPEIVTEPTDTYDWWRETINNAATEAITSNYYNPVFNINSLDQFQSFINLVNGTASTKDGTELTHVNQKVKEGTKWVTQDWWCFPTTTKDTVWVRQNGVNLQIGETKPADEFIFYMSYTPQDGTTPAFTTEEYLHGAYNFYETSLARSFVINLNVNLDLGDRLITAIGTESNPFKGVFNGNMYTISNVNVDGGYLFNYINGAVISNLNVSSTHKTTLVKEARNGCRILGVSMKANSKGASLVETVEPNTILGAANPPCYIVGCIHEGMYYDSDVTGTAEVKSGLVGTINANTEVFMYGNMETGYNISGGALCKEDNSGTLSPQTGGLSWGNCMCNYYDIEHSPSATAVNDIKWTAYKAQEYVRGGKSYILRAKNYMPLPEGVPYSQIKDNEFRRASFYGLPPYQAMNAAIYYYNHHMTSNDGKQTCNAHFEVLDEEVTSYDHLYPVLVSVAPDGAYDINVLTEPN